MDSNEWGLDTVLTQTKKQRSKPISGAARLSPPFPFSACATRSSSNVLRNFRHHGRRRRRACRDNCRQAEDEPDRKTFHESTAILTWRFVSVLRFDGVLARLNAFQAKRNRHLRSTHVFRLL